ncbi:MAG: sulfatase-like hydrolase/transferase, partial [Bradyrhizobium sp.]
LRGAPTPRIDRLATEGLRLTNFNVEAQCTPSRSAILTGRFAIRSGTHSVPLPGQIDGLTQWEVTLAETVSAAGYATGAFGKWHLGSSQGRLPNDQGFDEWYGIPNSSDESIWPQQPDFDPAVAHFEYVMEGHRGEKTRKVKLYDAEARREMDGEVTDHAIDFMQRSVKADKPFFTYVPLTQPHLPTEAAKAFADKTGNGPFADMLAEMDANVGRILDAAAALKIQDNTIVIFTSDNGPEDTMPWRGWAGPWTGTYNTAMEASLRVPFIMRWPGKVPTGRVSNETVHEVDLYTTLANLGGADIPTDRVVDGVDESAFLLGRQEKSARIWFPAFQAIGSTGPQLYAMKWRNYKMHLIWQERMFDPPQTLLVPRLIDLYDNPQERIEETTGESTLITHGWVAHAMFGELARFQASLKKYPPVAMGAADPYTPVNGQ